MTTEIVPDDFEPEEWWAGVCRDQALALSEFWPKEEHETTRALMAAILVLTQEVEDLRKTIERKR